MTVLYKWKKPWDREVVSELHEIERICDIEILKSRDVEDPEFHEVKWGKSEL